MPPRAVTTPGFGQADLSNCEREQIHLAGSIHPHGALLLVREPNCVIVQASASATLRGLCDETARLGRPYGRDVGLPRVARLARR